MKVILLKDIPALGRKNDVKEVSGGYARNFLLPQRMAEPATDAAITALSAKKAGEGRQRTTEENRYREAAEKLKHTPLLFKMKVGERGKAFGSVTAHEIADALKQKGVDADKEWIMMDKAIKTTGEKIIPIHFPHGVMGEIKLLVEAQ